MSRTIMDWGALGPDWRWRERWMRTFGIWDEPMGSEPNYYTSCPASIQALPVVQGVTRHELPLHRITLRDYGEQ